jgi:hypothetical protein
MNWDWDLGLGFWDWELGEKVEQIPKTQRNPFANKINYVCIIKYPSHAAFGIW